MRRLDPGGTCRDDGEFVDFYIVTKHQYETYVVFYMRQRYKNLIAAITIPPTVSVVANDQIIK